MRNRATRPAATASTKASAPLSPELTQHFQPSMGGDFSSVRMHTDAEAGASAVALGANAYSLGSDIVFAPGQYAPATAVGRQLIAHELTHVRQEQARRPDPAKGIMIDAPGSAQERQAESASRADAAEIGRPMQGPRMAAAHAGPILHRSIGAAIGGSILGGVVGAAIPAAIFGALLGPVAGALAGIAGGIGGAVAGYFIGEAASTTRRRLKPDEKTYLTDIFHTSVNLNAIEIARGAALGAGTARTTGNTINLPDGYFVGGSMDLNPRGLLTLAHETGHVWQYQHGGFDYIPSSLIPQAVGASSGSRNAAYNWRNAVDNNRPWHTWNAEQQAQCMSDYNEALRRIQADAYGPDDPQRLRDFNTVSMAEPYIELVREGIGAPGSRNKERASPGAAPAGGTP